MVYKNIHISLVLTLSLQIHSHPIIGLVSCDIGIAEGDHTQWFAVGFIHLIKKMFVVISVCGLEFVFIVSLAEVRKLPSKGQTITHLTLQARWLLSQLLSSSVRSANYTACKCTSSWPPQSNSTCKHR